ncbi:MAG: hypothetical protein ACOC1L_03680, partial [Bacillota bacterium]
MNKKRKILRITITVFMVLSLSLTTSKTLAYWANDIGLPSNTTSVAIVTTGAWSQAFPYDSNCTYS